MAATVTATFADPDAARQAAVELERNGIDAHHITVETDTARATPTNRNTGIADVEMTSDVAGRYAIGGVIGALVGAALAIGVVLLLQPDQLALALVFAGVGGGIAGFWLGGFWGGSSKLPVDSESYDTYRPDAVGATLVVSAADMAAADEIRSMVEDLDPTGVMVDSAGPGR